MCNTSPLTARQTILFHVSRVALCQPARWLFAVAILAVATSPAGAVDPVPRVLILGDSVYAQPAREAATTLKGRVELVYATMQPGEVRNTTTALANLERLLGETKWDLIHFNFGLGDLVYRAPGMKSFRVFPKDAGGVRATDSQQYEKNLRELVQRLQATEAKLIWASTTPIRHSTTNIFELGSEIEANRIAARVMADQGVPINDMYAYVKNLIDMNRPASHGADPFYFDRKPLHPPIVSNVLRELDLMQNQADGGTAP